MQQVSFSEAAALCNKAHQPIQVSVNGDEVVYLMNENDYLAYQEIKRVNNVSDGFEHKEHAMNADIFLRELRLKYEL